MPLRMTAWELHGRGAGESVVKIAVRDAIVAGFVERYLFETEY